MTVIENIALIKNNAEQKTPFQVLSQHKVFSII